MREGTGPQSDGKEVVTGRQDTIKIEFSTLIDGWGVGLKGEGGWWG